MKLKLSAIAVSAALAFSAASASADDVVYMTGGHAYVGVGAGYGRISNTKTGNAAFKAEVGYLMYQQQVAYGAEVSYNNVLRNSYSYYSAFTGNLTAQSVDLVAVGKYYLDPQFNIGLKAGGAYAMQKQTVDPTSGAPGVVYNAHRIVPVLGAGVGYSVTQNIAATLDYKYYFEAGDIKEHANTVMAGVDYNF